MSRRTGATLEGYVVGIDLSEPSNPADAAMDTFLVATRKLSICETVVGTSDPVIIQKIAALTSEGEVVAGLDSPLSYNVGGGDRPGDARLWATIAGVGLRSGTVMPPTMYRMVYPTLHRVSVARLITGIKPRTPESSKSIPVRRWRCAVPRSSK